MKDKKINIMWTLVFALLAVLTVRVILKQSSEISLEKLMGLVVRANKPLLALSAVASALYVWFEGKALRSILRRAGYPRRKWNGLIYATSDVYFSAITPSATGGQPASAFFMIRDGVPVGVTTATLVLNLMMYTISIVVLGLAAILVNPALLLGFNRISRVFIITGFVALTLLSAFFLLILRRGDGVFDVIERFLKILEKRGIIKDGGRVTSKVARTREDYGECSKVISGRKRIILKAFMWNLLQRSCQLAVPSILFMALGGASNLSWTIFAKQVLITIGYNIVPIPGGMGISDYLMIDGFRGIMGQDMAYGVELLSRGITFYICVAISGIITLAGYLKGNENDRSI